MKRVAASLMFFIAVAASGSARAETFIPFETGMIEVGTDADAALDSSLPDVGLDAADALDVLLDAPLDALDDSAVSDDADAAAPDTETPDTADTAPIEDAYEASVDTATPRDTAPATDTTVTDTGEPVRPPVITENQGDPFARTPERGDGCTCTTPGRGDDAAAYAAMLALALVMLRRKPR